MKDCFFLFVVKFIVRCHKLFSDEVLKTVKAKSKKIDNSIQWIDIEDDPLYMMMPVWFFTFRHGNKPYTILVNGLASLDYGNFGSNRDIQPYNLVYNYQLELGVRYSKKKPHQYSYLSK